MAGDFSYSDAPRHALNGVFIKDMVAAFPWRDPAGYAMQYYVQYPALSILFYPPLFYVISAPFYALFFVLPAPWNLPALFLAYLVLQSSLPVNVVLGQELSPRHMMQLSFSPFRSAVTPW